MRSFSIVPLVRCSIVAMTASVISLFASTSSSYAYAEPADASPLPIRTIVIHTPRHVDVTDIQAASADGSVIVGFNAALLGGTSAAIRWTAQTGVQELDISDVKASRAFNVSNDGLTISGAVDGKDGKSQGFRWTTDKGLQKFGSDWRRIETAGMSDNGSVIVGTFWHRDYDPQAFYWTERDGVQSLANDQYFQALKLTDTAAHGVSGDGSTIVGWAADEDRHHAEAFRWTRARGAQYIGDLGGGDSISNWMGVSRNGTAIVGSTCDGGYRVARCHVFRWTEKDGLKNLMPESSNSMALGMSPDGLNVFGAHRVDGQSHFFIWTEAHGVHDVGEEDEYQYVVTNQEIIRIAVR